MEQYATTVFSKNKQLAVTVLRGDTPLWAMYSVFNIPELLAVAIDSFEIKIYKEENCSSRIFHWKCSESGEDRFSVVDTIYHGRKAFMSALLKNSDKFPVTLDYFLNQLEF